LLSMERLMSGIFRREDITATVLFIDILKPRDYTSL